jgi:peptidoglycan LD-endopeptidase LytH
MSRLALLVVGMVIGVALVILPIERGWITSQGVQAVFHPGAVRSEDGSVASLAAPATVASPVVAGTAPFGATAQQPMPPPLDAGDLAELAPTIVPPIGNDTQTPPPSTDPTPALSALPLPPDAPALLVPVRGVTPGQLSDTFTQSRGEGRRHDAIDILAPRGTPVLAVADGKIEKLFLSKPGGRTIYQFDPGRKVAYYYAHLDAYAPQLSEGQTVVRGQVIGYVGSTGNASPEAPHLHFAIFVLGPGQRWWQGTAINPYLLLGGG